MPWEFRAAGATNSHTGEPVPLRTTATPSDAVPFPFRASEDGGICCGATAVRKVPTYACPKCKSHFATLGLHPGDSMKDVPPDSYEQALTSLRANLATLEVSSSTRELQFEDRYKAERTRELDAEHAEIDAHIEAAPVPRHLSDAELSDYAPPDPYAAGIKALQEKERRR